MRKALAFLMIVALAGAANAASITVTSETPDLSAYAAYGGRLVTELTQYTYHVTKTDETGELNAFEVHVSTTTDNEYIHQVYNYVYKSLPIALKGYYYTDTTLISEIGIPMDQELDTGLLTDGLTLGVGVDDEDIVNMTEDTKYASEWDGPTEGPMEAEYFENVGINGLNYWYEKSGYGSAYDFVGASEDELADLDLFQLVIPSGYFEVDDGGDIVVEIVAATPTETTRKYFHYVIPEPATLSLLALGAGAALLRRKRS